MNDDKIREKLQAPFDPEDVEWLPAASGINVDGKPWVVVAPYITNRAVQARLDEVFGLFGWENESKELSDGSFLTGITIIHPDGRRATKWDGAERTNIEPVKGGLSNAMKRAAVQLGIGRYLYKLPTTWAECVISESRSHVFGNVIEKKKEGKFIAWRTPDLPFWARPQVDLFELLDNISSSKTIDDLKTAFEDAVKMLKINHNTKDINKVIEAKDVRKAIIENELVSKKDEDSKAIYDWMRSQLNVLGRIPTKEAVECFTKNLAVQLRSKVANTALEADDFISEINQKTQNRLNQLGEENDQQDK